MRKFEELQDREKEEIAKSIALSISTNKPPFTNGKDHAERFIIAYNSIIEEFSKR